MTSGEDDREEPDREVVESAQDSESPHEEFRPEQRDAELPLSVLERRVSVKRERFFSGPLPHPDYMAKYEQVLPGSADRILTRSEKEQQMRHRNVSALVQAGIRREREGLLIGGFLALVFLVGSFILIGLGRTQAGLIAIGGETAILAIVYLRAQHVRNRSPGEGTSEE